ncbi:hypothetical protein FISHEDRAFT_76670 [Fistulina hepatica ATCC 64428]|uniref:Uncharacterized protein n=1 Tax=Fistulina hepatica ATCC 64428 TaxID=1128425 RepID=A0A0D7A6F2_9AGAR|nr:hypothetical protein FISHEDRAFT_76670 [Fistulina hepatica ATCC 64428]
MSPISSFALVASFFLAFAAANFTIEYPGSDYWWITDSVNVVGWSCTEDAPADEFALLIGNINTSIIASPQVIVKSFSNWDCSQLIYANETNFTVADGYYLELTEVGNTTKVYAKSDDFKIESSGSTYPSTSASASTATATEVKTTKTKSSSTTGTSTSTATSSSSSSSSSSAGHLQVTATLFGGLFAAVVALTAL